MRSDDIKTVSKKYHCINCGKIWGKGNDVNSYGVCLECFADYINKKKISKGFYPCFGKLDQDFRICCSCKWFKFCKEFYEEHYYGIKYDLSW